MCVELTFLLNLVPPPPPFLVLVDFATGKQKMTSCGRRGLIAHCVHFARERRYTYLSVKLVIILNDTTVTYPP